MWTRKRRKKSKRTVGVKNSKSESKVADRVKLTHDRSQHTGESRNERWMSPTKALGVMKSGEETYPTGGLANYVPKIKVTVGSEVAEDSLASSTLGPRSAERVILEENLDKIKKGIATGQLAPAQPEELVERREALELEQAKVRKSECEGHGATRDQRQRTSGDNNERWLSPTKLLGVMERSEDTYPIGGLANFVPLMKTVEGSKTAEDCSTSNAGVAGGAERGVLEKRQKHEGGARTDASSLYHEEGWSQVGLKVWRIHGYAHGSRETVLIPHIAPRDAAQCDFYSEDCYIVMKTCLTGSNKSDLCHHVHTWIGQESSTVKQHAAEEHVADLTRGLNGSVVVHREVQYDESELLQSYFMFMFHNKGSSESRFEGLSFEAQQDYKRLYLVKKKSKKVYLYEVDRVASNMNHDGVFVLDSGKTINVWFGESSSPFERFIGSIVATNMALRRPGCTKKLTKDDEDFLMSLGAPNGDTVPQHAASLSDTLQAITYGKNGLLQLHPVSDSSKGCFLLLDNARRNGEQTGCVRVCSL